MKRNKKNYGIYVLMLLVFGGLIYVALQTGERFSAHAVAGQLREGAFGMFKSVILNNLRGSLTVLLFQIIVILLTVRLFSGLFRFIGQPGVIGEIVAGIVLGPSVLGLFFPDLFRGLFPEDSLMNLELLSQIGLVLFMFVIGMDVDFSMLRNKMNETLVISHAGIIVPFFLGIVASFWVYEEYAAGSTAFLPFALFIGISMSITAFPVLARIIQERNMTRTPTGVLAIASAANDDVTAWCLLAVVIAVAKAGTFLSALYTVGLTVVFILVMFVFVRPFLAKIGRTYAHAEVINKSFVGFIFLVLIVSAVMTEIIGIHALFGAFMAGVIMPANSGFRRVMMEKVEDVALVFFLPLFFAFTGLRTEIGLINTPQLWGVCVLLIFVAILGKLGGCTLAARLVGESWKDSFMVGTLMNTRGLMELVALNIGYEMGVLPPEVFVILILMALTTTFMTTPLLKLFERIFGKSGVASARLKVLLSFGRPESGQNLLALAARLLGKRVADAAIVAVHYTVGTDLNPVKAGQYARNSFKPLNREARRLNLQVDKRYQVTDRLVHDIGKLAKSERADLLLLGAGPQFMQEHFSGWCGGKIPVRRLLQKLQRHSLRLPGELFRDKLQPVIENTESSVAIFVSRSRVAAKQFFLFLDGESDLDFLSYMRGYFTGEAVRIRICFLAGESVTPLVRQKVEELVAAEPCRFLADVPLKDNLMLYQPDSLLVLSYGSCLTLSRNPLLFSRLPSLLVVRQ